MKLTKFTFFKNTPFTNFQNTILFNSNSERDNFFLNGNHYEVLSSVHNNFNFIRDRQTVDLPISYHDFRGVNYCTFISDFEPTTRFYAYVIRYEYINDKNIRVYLLIDGIMTYCQGNTLENLKGLKVYRSHLSLSEYNQRIDELKNNDDVIKTHTKAYTHENKYIFKEFDMLIQSSCSFTTDFGEVNDPKIDTSSGITFDKITSPLNIYVVKQSKFVELMDKMSKFPWITQNIRSVSLIPSILLEDRIVKVTPESFSFDGLYTLVDGQSTNATKLDLELLEISKDINKLYETFDLDEEQEKHLLRNEYTTSELYTYDGQQLYIDNGLLNNELGLLIRSVYVSGHHNEIGLYIDGYRGSTKDSKGSFLNDAIFFRNFDDVPIMIDNFNLSMAKSAHQRQLAESKLISNRISNVFNNESSIRDRFFDATSIMTNLNPFNLMGRFVDEHEFYRQQEAQHKDLALETPTITNQSNNNSLAISREYFGIHLKHAQPNKKEWEKVKKYYKLYGFELNDEHSIIKVRTNTICNYVQFQGDYTIPNCDPEILEMIKAQFENGVRLWHNNNTPNPMTQNVLLNRMK